MAARDRGRWRWLLVGLVLLSVWVGAGVFVPLGAAGFLLLGGGFVVAFQLMRRRSLRGLLARDGASLARSRPGKALVGLALVCVPVFLLVRYVSTWPDYGWIAGLSVAVLAVAYAATRRLAVAVIVTAVLVTAVSWSQAPRLPAARHGDPVLLSKLDDLHRSGGLQGFQDLTVVTIDLTNDQPVREASIGTAAATTPVEIGSITKALTGLVIADSVRRGEIRLDAPVSTYLPQLRGAPAGEVTMRELVTHRSGYPQFGAATLRRAAWSSLVGRNWIDTDTEQMIKEVRAADLIGRGTYAYSTLAAATAGQAAAAAAGMSYPDLMRTRLFAPLGMTHTAIQTGRPLVAGGQDRTGLAEQPWVFDAYAPGGGAVSTAADLTVLATALLNSTAPGMDALTPIASSDTNNDAQIGAFWRISHWQNGQDITWHNGGTAGYTSYLGIDRQHHTAAIVLSAVSLDPDTTDLGINLLAEIR